MIYGLGMQAPPKPTSIDAGLYKSKPSSLHHYSWSVSFSYRLPPTGTRTRTRYYSSTGPLKHCTRRKKIK